MKFANKDWAGEKKFFGAMQKRYQNNWQELPYNVSKFLSYLNQPLVLRIVEFITDEIGLIPDPYLNGGGIHSTGEDGFLKLHTDFNWNKKLKLYRRINILVYLNKDWKSEYGGQIELAGKKANGSFKTYTSLKPIFNRTLIFITDDESYHGHPKPVKHPLKKRRDSIAAYYYIASKPEGISENKRIDTNYVDENGKKLNASFLKKLASKIRFIA